jgi:hypothetical protein
VRSANSIGSDKVHIVGRRPFIYIMKSKGPTIDTWGTPSFIALHFEKNYECYSVILSEGELLKRPEPDVGCRAIKEEED